MVDHTESNPNKENKQNGDFLFPNKEAASIPKRRSAQLVQTDKPKYTGIKTNKKQTAQSQQRRKNWQK
ncbi:hypothetical protein JCM19046_3455 [Bacillus sp. JCM 19046]|nr:hypothetical protein JCM19046_3455 [Bacillus sp. JCM 19046]